MESFTDTVANLSLAMESFTDIVANLSLAMESFTDIVANVSVAIESFHWSGTKPQFGRGDQAFTDTEANLT